MGRQQRETRLDAGGVRLRGLVLAAAGVDIHRCVRHREVVRTRHACMVMLRERGWSTSRVAAALGLADHSTVSTGLARALRCPATVELARLLAAMVAGRGSPVSVRRAAEIVADWTGSDRPYPKLDPRAFIALGRSLVDDRHAG